MKTNQGDKCLGKVIGEILNLLKRLHDASRVVLIAASAVLIVSSAAAAADIGEHKKACSPPETKAVTKALADAKAALGKAVETFKIPSPADVSRQQKWFGALAGDTAKKVRERGVEEAAIVRIAFSQFYCPVSNDLIFKWERGDVAAVHPNAPGAVFLTPAFFKRPVAGAHSQMGTFIHEVTHLVGIGLRPEEYGTTKAKALAEKDPAKARNNSDNYMYYIEDLMFELP